MKDIIDLLPILAVAIIMNIEAGLYYNIGKMKLRFDKSFFVSGILKAGIVTSLFLGTAYCFEAAGISFVGDTPPLIIKSAISLYVGKSLVSLGKILGIHVNVKEHEQSNH